MCACAPTTHFYCYHQGHGKPPLLPEGPEGQVGPTATVAESLAQSLPQTPAEETEDGSETEVEIEIEDDSEHEEIGDGVKKLQCVIAKKDSRRWPKDRTFSSLEQVRNRLGFYLYHSGEKEDYPSLMAHLRNTHGSLASVCATLPDAVFKGILQDGPPHSDNRLQYRNTPLNEQDRGCQSCS
ncbi:hypothetical protein E2C01_061060 [Portunus trituberculatus]|uniref:Uncharacterized protein n=1 Tax=Portunus trituberculatus TaxID=210409 RepID=A0A5B7HBA3_PORTR|nr:hypothetical protein [Portunus trituberculatus]